MLMAMTKTPTERSLSAPKAPEVPYEIAGPIIAKLKATPPEPISMEDAQQLAQWTVALTLKGLENLFDHRRDWVNPRGDAQPHVQQRRDNVTDIYVNNEEALYPGKAPKYWERYISHKCLQAQDLADVLLGELPDALLTPIHSDVFSHINHAFVILTLPIEENGKTVTKHFIIDPTIAQFFYDNGRDQGHTVGEKLLAGNEAFADELLTRGFAELSEERAKLYVDSFVPEADRKYVDSILERNGGSYLNFLKDPAIADVRAHHGHVGR